MTLGREQRELLESAVRCYLRAGEEDAACRVLGLLEAWGDAAGLHERAGRVAEAAALYERARRPLDAARCHRAARRFDEEARCLIAGEDLLGAAWVLAHDLRRFEEARAVIARFDEHVAAETTPKEGTAAEPPVRRLPGSPLERSWVLARCDLGQGRRGAATRTVVEQAPQLAATFWGSRAVAWALALCDLLRRPDLTAILFAGSAGADDRIEAEWDEWTHRVLGVACAPPFHRSASLAEGEAPAAGAERAGDAAQPHEKANE